MYFLVSFVAAGVSNVALATEVPSISSSPAPTWCEMVSDEQLNLKQTDEEADYILFDSQRLLKNSDTKRCNRHIARANTPSAVKQFAEVSVSFDPAYQQLSFHRIDLIRNGQRLNRLQIDKFKLIQQETELSRSIYNGAWTALLVLDDIRPGDVVDYGYTISGQNPVFGNKYFGAEQLTWTVPIQKRRVRIIADPELPLTFRTNKNTELPSVEKSPHQTVYTLERINQKSELPEDRMPLDEVIYDYLEYSEYEHWDKVVNWALPLYTFKEKNSELDKAFQNIIGHERDNNKNVESLIRFVQNEIRYFGIEFGTNSHAPSAPEETLARRYGDCKDKAVLLSALLKKLGLKAHPALVSAENRQHIAKRLPSPIVFDHVIVRYIQDGKTYWVDPTYTEQGGAKLTRTLPPYERALVIDGAQKGLQAIAAHEKSQTSSLVKIDEAFSFLDQSAAMDIRLSIEYQGWRADEVRADIKASTNDVYQKGMKEYFQKNFNGAEVVTSMTKIDDVENNTLTLKFHFKSPNPHKDNAARSEYMLVNSIMRDYLLKPEVMDRKFAFRLLPEIHVTQSTRITFPENRKILWKSDNGSREIKNEYFSISRNTLQENNSVAIETNYVGLDPWVKAKEISNYVEQSNKALNELVTVVWTDRVTPNAQGIENEKMKGLINRLRSGQ